MIDIDYSEIKKLVRQCSSSNRNISSQAINKLSGNIKREYAGLMAGELNLPLSTIEQAVNVSSSGDELKLTVNQLPFQTASTGAIPLYRFQPSQGFSGTKVTVKKTKGRKEVKNAFIARLKSGYTGVFTRYSKSGGLLQRSGRRSPIRQLYTSSITEIASNHVNEIEQFGTDEIVNNFLAAIARGC
jgi:hypothetical protein